MNFDMASILNLAIYFLSIDETSKTSQLLLFIINSKLVCFEVYKITWSIFS